MTKTNHKCNDFKTPSSLKELLDLFAALNGANGSQINCKDPTDAATKAIFEEIRKRLKGDEKKNDGWVRSGPNPFCKDNENSGNNSGSMIDTIRGLKDLRKNIGNGTNDTYTLPNPNATSDPCIKKYADAIIQNAFPLFGCLFYLWFMCDYDQSGAKDIKNGNNTLWEEQNVKNGNGSSLNNFLTDQQPTAEQLKKRMLTRGFGNGGNMKSDSKGKDLFQNGKALFDLDCTGGGNGHGHFQQALFFLLCLAPRWHPAMSGHALLFLHWFSKNAKEEPFNDVQWLHVTGAGTKFFNDCTQLSGAITALASNTTGGISPVYTNTTTENGQGTNGNNLYWPQSNGQGAKTILHNENSFKNDQNGHKKAHVFMQYVSWLWWCIPHLTASLKEMSADSKEWKSDNFNKSQTFGPFPWGFTFPTRYHITCMT